MKLRFILIVLVLLGVGWWYVGSVENRNEETEYKTEIMPGDFSNEINTKYLRLPVGRKLVYEADTDEGIERVEIDITGETKNVMGVETLVYLDRVYVDGKLVEDTRDYLAQDKKGNVWYFGEDVDNYEDGELVDHAGSWLAGVDGAEAGLWIKANPQVGDTYRQEYYEGEAEDMVEVMEVGIEVDVNGMTYLDCIKTYDWTPLDPEAREYKYYCPEVGGLVVEEDLESGVRSELVEYN